MPVEPIDDDAECSASPARSDTLASPRARRSDSPPDPERATSRWMVWSAYVVMLMLAAAWWCTFLESSVGLHAFWPRPVHLAAFVLALLLPLFCRARGGSSVWLRISIGVTAVAALMLAHWADAVSIGIVETMQPPRLDAFCSWRPPLVPTLAYIGIGWLPLVLRAEAEACELLGQRRSAEAMGLRRRWLGLAVGVLLGLVVGEAVFFLGAYNCWDSRFEDLRALAAAPIVALLLLELCVRVSRPVAPGYEPLEWIDDDLCARWIRRGRAVVDPVALLRKHRARRLARVVAALVIVGGLLTLRWVAPLPLTVSTWPVQLSSLVVAVLALLLMAALALAPRPRPDRRRRPAAPGLGLSDSLRRLLGELGDLRSAVERGRDRDLWEQAIEVEVELAALGDSDRELLERRRVDIDALVRALRCVDPLTSSLSNATRRAMHAELTRFISSARDPGEQHPYREGSLRGPEPWVDESPSSYSAAFERERARVRRSRRRAAILGVVTSATLCCTIVAATTWTVTPPWRWHNGRLLLTLIEVLAGLTLLGAATLVTVWNAARRREGTSVASVWRLHRVGTVAASATLRTELVAQRLAWAEGPGVNLEALEHCAALLCAATELGSLAPGDRQRLIDRLGDAIALGETLDRRQRRALELELATAERLLGHAGEVSAAPLG